MHLIGNGTSDTPVFQQDPPAFPGAPAAESVERELDQILRSAIFARSKELCRFLRFAVEQKLRNRSVRLKEYLIGVTVFGRGESFNPGTDPIVRVQARRLRSKLRLYYETEGHQDSVVIELPSGGYVPFFRLRTATVAEPGRPDEASAERRRSVVVLPFVNVGPAENERFSDGLTDELIHVLSKTGDLRVVARTSAFHFKGKTDDIRSIGERLGVDALVEGTVRSQGNHLRVSAGLIDVSDGAVLWSGVYEQTADEMFAVQAHLSERIAERIEAQLIHRAESNPPAIVPA